jgi:hypothetical protein
MIFKLLPVTVSTRDIWEISPRPTYLTGIRAAALQAKRQKVGKISVAEFGGQGLLAMQEEAEAVEKETGIAVQVYGFDAKGLPEFIGDHRDHPDVWRHGDFPMDEQLLRSKLNPDRTTLIIGNVRDTAKEFWRWFDAPPIGFISFDLDLYSSTRDALQIFLAPETRMLWHVPLYFDDIDFLFNYSEAGEFLAIREFNVHQKRIFIDRWHGVREGRPFPEHGAYDKFFVAHDISALNKIMTLEREVRIL